MLENGGTLEAAAVQQDSVLCEHAVDAVQPLLERFAAALEDEALLLVHFSQVVYGNFLNDVIAHARYPSFFVSFSEQARMSEAPCRSREDARAYGPFPPRGRSR